MVKPDLKLLNKIIYVSVLILFCVIIVISPYSRLLVKFSLFAAIGLWFAAIVLDYKKNFLAIFSGNRMINVSLIILGLSCFLSVALSKDPYHSQKILVGRYALFFASYCIGFWLISCKEDCFTVKIACIAILLSASILAAGCIRDYIIFKPARLFSVFGKDIAFSMLPLFLSYFVSLVFGFCLFSINRRVKYISWLVFAALLPCLIWQGARTAWVACAISIGLLSFFKNRKVFFHVITAVIILLTLGLFSSNVRGKLATIPNPSEWNHRTPLYESAIKIFRDNPVLGSGIGIFEQLIKSPPYKLPADYPGNDMGLYIHAHSFYFEVLAEMGIIGLLAFLLFFAVFLKKAYSSLVKLPKSFEKAFIGAAISMVTVTLIYGITGSLITVGVNETIMFWLLLGFGIGLIKKITNAYQLNLN